MPVWASGAPAVGRQSPGSCSGGAHAALDAEAGTVAVGGDGVSQPCVGVGKFLLWQRKGSGRSGVGTLQAEGSTQPAVLGVGEPGARAWTGVSKGWEVVSGLGTTESPGETGPLP